MGNQLYKSILEIHLASVEEALPKYLPKNEQSLQKLLYEIMGYACESGGKRLRPILALEFCRVCGGDTARAMPFACAIEMIHSYSLIHDDLPCMDNSPIRRGRPSSHVAYGEDMALLAGDALLNRAFEVILEPANRSGLPAESVLRAAYELANASGAEGMVGGQVIDLLYENKPINLDILEKLQYGKTAAIIEASCAIGCHIAGAGDDKLTAAREYGSQIGLAFQIVDDILDATATSEQLGKPVRSDVEHGKATYVSLLGIEEAKRLAEKRTENAVNALSVFGDEIYFLSDLAYALLRRKN
jgi:geranylgeranyl diphosphate synthase type II